MIQLIRGFTFCAAHHVPNSPGEAARRLHGHNFGVELVLEGEIDKGTGWLVDFGDIARAFAPCADLLDHSYLNEIEGLENPDNPTVAGWIYHRLKPNLLVLKSARVHILGELQFNARRLVEDVRLELPERLGFSLESAHRLPFVGVEHKCSGVHGHSYRVEVGAGDSARLIESLRSIYDRLDHRYLNEIEGLENPTSEVMAKWIWLELLQDHHNVDCVVVRESPQCVCIYRGENA